MSDLLCDVLLGDSPVVAIRSCVSAIEGRGIKMAGLQWRANRDSIARWEGCALMVKSIGCETMGRMLKKSRVMTAAGIPIVADDAVPVDYFILETAPCLD